MNARFTTFVIALLMASCGGNTSRSKSCSNQKPNQPLAIVDGVETSSFPSVVLFMSGKKGGQMAKCTGTVVGHNSIITAAHCITGSTSDIYVMQGSRYIGSDHDVALKTAISPNVIVSHGTITNSTGKLAFSQRPDDLVVFIFKDKTFSQKDVIIPSLLKLDRPSQFSEVILTGFGKSSINDHSDTSIKRMGRGRYVYNPTIGKDLVFTFDRDVNDQTFAALGSKEYSLTLQGDSGGPLLAKTSRGLEVVGVLSGGGTSTDGSVGRSIYVDLYSARSLELLSKARSKGAVFNDLTVRDSSDEQTIVANSTAGACL